MYKKFILWLLPLGILIYGYYPTFVWMADRWLARDSYFGHGILIPFISLYWVLRKRKECSTLSKNSEPWGLLILLAGVGLQIFSSVLQVYFLSAISLVWILLGAVLFLFGRRVLKQVWFPICFLLLMVPFPILFISEITLKLKFFVTEISVFCLKSMGIHATREGSYLYMPHSYLIVGDPCSGLRSLLAFLILGLVFSYGSGLNGWRRAIVVASGFPLALVSNIGRVLFLALVSEIYGMNWAHGVVHDASGVAAFLFAIAIFLAIRRKLETPPVPVMR